MIRTLGDKARRRLVKTPRLGSPVGRKTRLRRNKLGVSGELRGLERGGVVLVAARSRTKYSPVLAGRGRLRKRMDMNGTIYKPGLDKPHTNQ